ncbi:MAG TPA: carboxypeptidase regulatory-like domain-containing protein, partial [Polyangia bacterium]
NFRLQVNADGVGRHGEEVRVAKDVPDFVIKLDVAGSVKGQVLSQGRPVSGAEIDIRVMPRVRMGPIVNAYFERGTTDADGRFSFTGVGAGDLDLSVLHKELGAAQITGSPLAAGEHRTVTLTLKESGSISGTVRYDDGRPASGARIDGQRMGPGSGRWSDVTRADGTYRLSMVSAGEVHVSASVTGSSMWGGRERPDYKRVTLADNEHKTGLDLVVPGALTISGIVTGAGGAPVFGAEVTASVERDGRTFRGMVDARAFSDTDGKFTLDRVGAGRYTLWAAHAGFGDLETKGIAGGASDVKLQLAPEATLAGVVVTSDGRPVSDYTAILFPGAPANETPAAKRERISGSLYDKPVDNVRDPAGRFSFTRVSAGSHELRVTTAAGLTATLPISVTAGEKKTGLRVTVQPAARVTGRVLDAESQAPLADVHVRSSSPNAMGRMAPVKTDANGGFSFEGLTPGETLSLMFSADPEKYLVERRTVEGTNSDTVDLGTILLARGNVSARMKEGTWAGTPGLRNSEDDKATVAIIRPNMPAEAAGIKAQDAILSVDGKSVRGLGFGAVEYLLRGKPGSTITMVVQTPGSAPRTVTMTRADVNAPPPATSTAARPAASPAGQTNTRSQ